MNIIAIVIIPLAVWRISNMLSDYEQVGPFDILHKIRIRTGMYYDQWSQPMYKSGSFADMMSCVYCNSIWLGIVFTILWLVNQEVTIIVSLPFALSAMAIIIEEWKNSHANKT